MLDFSKHSIYVNLFLHNNSESGMWLFPHCNDEAESREKTDWICRLRRRTQYREKDRQKDNKRKNAAKTQNRK